MSNTIHQEILVPAAPEKIYSVLTEGGQFSSMSGMPAEIVADIGASFSCFGGMITGVNIELVPNARVVQAWRPKNWDEGVYSLVRFELKNQGSETKLIFDHIGFPEEHRDHLESGWHERYWGPLKKFLS